MSAQTKEASELEDREYSQSVQQLVSEIFVVERDGKISDRRMSVVANQLRDIAESFPNHAFAEGQSPIRTVYNSVMSGLRDRIGKEVPQALRETLDYERVLIAMTPERKRNHPH